MKKILLILVLFVFARHGRAQFVFIPDSNFRNYIITYIDSNAISGNSLDTTNSNVVSLKFLQLDFFGNLITDLTGIEYFDSLETLKINFLNLSALPALPPLLQHLEAQGNAFSSLPDLPQNLQTLDVAFNSLVNLPLLPASLSHLNASSNFLTSLPPLPASLIYINAANNQITQIDSFPSSLLYIIIWGNQIDSLPLLPAGLSELNVSDNDLSFLPALPPQLLVLYCSLNPLVAFPLLAEGLQFLDCINTVSCLPPLPNSLVNLNFDGCLSNHPLSLTDYYPLCNAEVTLIEVADSAPPVCNDTLKFAGGYTSYLWNTGSTSAVLPGICRGVYTATLTDSTGCIYTSNIDIADTALQVSAVSNTESSCNRVGICGYVIDVTVTGGTPPYSYKWSDSSGEIDFSIISDSAQDLIHFCLSDVLSVDDVKCVVTDAAGRQDSVIKTVFDNIPPEPFFIDIVNPVCPGYPTGYIYLEDDPLTPGGTVFIMETNLDTGEYIYTVPYGNGCEEVYTIQLEHQFSDCSNMYSYAITPPDSALCNGTFTLVDNVDHGIYNLANIDLQFDGLYIADGTSVPPTELCMNTWYYFYVFDFNIGYFEQDSIYISQPQFAVVYPGDANNDNVANNVDLLAIGLAYNESGYARADTTLTWNAKTVQHWMDVFADSTNMCHADVNGNGIVNARDTTGILLNYGMTHLRPFQQSGAEPSILFALPDSIESNTSVEIPIHFGDSVVPADSVLGVAFTMQFDNAVIDTGSVRFIPDSSWLGTAGQDLISIQYRNASSLDVALTRTDHMVRSGFGSIGRLSFRTNVLVDTVYSVVSSQNVVFTDVTGFYLAGDGFSDSSLFYPAGCILNTALSVTHSCFDLYGGEAEASVIAGKPPYSYDWSVISSSLPVTLTNGIPVQSSLPTGSYQVIISDSAGCSDTLTAQVSSQDGDLITATTQNPTCPQICDGWIWLKGDSINGPSFTANWSTGQTSSILTGMCDGLYSVTVNWGEGCTENMQFLLSDPSPLSYFLSVDTPSCTTCNGSITVVAFGGRRPYNYTWSSSTDSTFQAFDSVAMNLCFNNSYEVQITDACLNLFDQGVFFSVCDSTVSVSETGVNAVSIFPNPNNGQFSVVHNFIDGRFEIIDAAGRQVGEGPVTAKETEIMLEGPDPGLYILVLHTESGILRKTFIVSHRPE